MPVVDLPRSRATDPETSHAAEPAAEKLTRIQQLVVNLFESEGAMTDSELNAAYQDLSAQFPGLFPKTRLDTPRKRRSELSRRGVLVDTGERRMSVWGRREVVWAMNPKGIQ